MDPAAALELVYEAIDTANELRREEERVPKAPHVPLIGDGGGLDSLALATLLLALERKVEEAAGRSVSLLDESVDDVEAQVRKIGTPQALAELIVQKLRA